MSSTTTVKRVGHVPGGRLPWHAAEILSLEHWPWNRDRPLPTVSARLLSTDRRLHARFEVMEQHILARRLVMQDEVWRDSCVELFLSADGSSYINFEINCIGTCLCCRCSPGRKFDSRPTGLADTDFQVATSLPKGREIREPRACPPGGYTVEFSIPFEFLARVLGAEPPSPGAAWTGNLYKCGEDLPVPHWGAWSEIRVEKPDFHRPEYFGTLLFS